MILKNSVHDFKIRLHRGSTEFHPGELIEGVLSWSSLTTDTKLNLCIGWYVHGGPQIDYRCHAFQESSPSGSSGEVPFSFRVPDGPVSYSGSLFEIQWKLEVLDTKSMKVLQFPFTVS